MIDSVGYQALIGSLLGDGGLTLSHGNRGNAVFSLSQSGAAHVDWLGEVMGLICRLGIEFEPDCPKVRIRESSRSGKPYEYCYIRTRTNSLLTTLHRAWYSGRRKVVPLSLVLTPIIILVWYLGDGCLSWTRGNKTGGPNTPGSSPQISFSTANFTLEEVKRLGREVKDVMGVDYRVHMGRDKRYPGSIYPELYIKGGRKAAGRLLSYIDVPELIPPSYRYKFERGHNL